MAGKQAKIINNRDLARLLRLVRNKRHADRNEAIVLFSVKAGLRASEIAGLTWGMVLNAEQQIGDVIELRDSIAKRGSGRTIPLHPKLKAVLSKIKRGTRPSLADAVLRSDRGGHLRPNSIVNWFVRLYRQASLDGCSSHSGRRTFITKAARLIYRVGGSLRDVQQLAGHASIEMTQRYIEGNTQAKRALVRLV